MRISSTIIQGYTQITLIKHVFFSSDIVLPQIAMGNNKSELVKKYFSRFESTHVLLVLPATLVEISGILSSCL